MNYKKLYSYINLESEVDDNELIHAAIAKDVIFKGTNFWILIFAIIVASVGLNMNSTAVIIGAMLISPLMGPIIGMGYSIATYNFPLFRVALKNFTFAVLASIAASTVYFSLSPVSTAHSELLARTTPTIYDVLIALFGGLAGIIAISSKQKGNVIPGVAIATALMPPLCTAGFGLATGQFVFFFGALYLFTINTVFIALSSVLICKILKFPIRSIVNESHRIKVKRWISVVITITVVPSIYFGYLLVVNEKFSENATRFTSSIRVYEGSYLLEKKIIPRSKSIVLVFGGKTLTKIQKSEIVGKAKDFSIEDASITFQQGFSTDITDTKKETEITKYQSEINRLTLLLNNTENYIDSVTKIPEIGKQLLSEIIPLYPEITGCSYNHSSVYCDSLDKPTFFEVVTLKMNNTKFKQKEKDKISAWLKKRLKTSRVKVFYEN